MHRVQISSWKTCCGSKQVSEPCLKQTVSLGGNVVLSHGSIEEGSTRKWVFSWLPFFATTLSCKSNPGEKHVASATNNLLWPPRIGWRPSQGNLVDGGDRNWRWILGIQRCLGFCTQFCLDFWSLCSKHPVWGAQVRYKVKGRVIFSVRADGLVLGVGLLLPQPLCIAGALLLQGWKDFTVIQSGHVAVEHKMQMVTGSLEGRTRLCWLEKFNDNTLFDRLCFFCKYTLLCYFVYYLLGAECCADDCCTEIECYAVVAAFARPSQWHVNCTMCGFLSCTMYNCTIDMEVRCMLIECFNISICFT